MANLKFMYCKLLLSMSVSSRRNLLSSWVYLCAVVGVLTLSPATHALSLGRLSGVPVLGQAFTGNIAASLAPGERLDSDCVKAELYNGEDKIAPNNISTEVIGEGETRQIRVRSTQRLTEPLLTVYLEAGCQGRISRRYTLFVDPLTVAAQSSDSGSSAQESLVAPRSLGQTPLPNISQSQPQWVTDGNPLSNEGGTAMSRPVAKPRITQPKRPRVITGQEPIQPKATARLANRTSQTTKSFAKTSVNENKPGSSRLTLDLANNKDAYTGTVASMQLSRELSFPVSAEENARRAELRVLRDALMAEIDGKVAPGEFAKRVQQLEAANDKLLKERAAALSQAAAEKAKREELEKSSFPAWALYSVLGALAASLLAAYVFWRRSQMYGDEDVAEQVFSPQSKTIDLPLNDFNESRVDPRASSAIEVDQLNENESIKWYERFVPARRKGISATDMPVTMPVPDEHGDSDALHEDALSQEAAQLAQASSLQDKRMDSQRRIVPAPLTPHEQLAVNEIADISQEAEFFIEIGEHERAISLLEGSLDSENHLTPVPQLYLFDLYRETGKQQAYENLRQKFSERFNAYVPKWTEDSSQVSRELADYPRALEQVCRSWRSDNIVPTLESLLVDDTRGSRLGFDLPAYREVIFLYGIAKQLELDSESDGYQLGIESLVPQAFEQTQSHVDLELPMMGAAAANTLTAQHESAIKNKPQVTEPSVKPSAKDSSVRQDITLDSRSFGLDFDLDFEDSKLTKPISSTSPPKTTGKK
jgi:pilus assembly protein FimV